MQDNCLQDDPWALVLKNLEEKFDNADKNTWYRCSSKLHMLRAARGLTKSHKAQTHIHCSTKFLNHPSCALLTVESVFSVVQGNYNMRIQENYDGFQ